MNLDDPASEVFQVAARLGLLDVVLPDARSLALADLLGLFEFLEVLGVEIHIFRHT